MKMSLMTSLRLSLNMITNNTVKLEMKARKFNTKKRPFKRTSFNKKIFYLLIHQDMISGDSKGKEEQSMTTEIISLLKLKLFQIVHLLPTENCCLG